MNFVKPYSTFDNSFPGSSTHPAPFSTFSPTGNLPLQPLPNLQPNSPPSSFSKKSDELNESEVNQRLSRLEKWIDKIADAVQTLSRSQQQTYRGLQGHQEKEPTENSTTSKSTKTNTESNNGNNGNNEKKWIILAIAISNGMMLILFIVALIVILVIAKQFSKSVSNIAPFIQPQINPNYNKFNNPYDTHNPLYESQSSYPGYQSFYKPK